MHTHMHTWKQNDTSEIDTSTQKELYQYQLTLVYGIQLILASCVEVWGEAFSN